MQIKKGWSWFETLSTVTMVFFLYLLGFLQLNKFSFRCFMMINFLFTTCNFLNFWHETVFKLSNFWKDLITPSKFFFKLFGKIPLTYSPFKKSKFCLHSNIVFASRDFLHFFFCYYSILINSRKINLLRCYKRSITFTTISVSIFGLKQFFSC